MVEIDENIGMGGGDEDGEEMDKNEDKDGKNLSDDMRIKFEETFKIFEKEQSGTMDIEVLGTFLRWLNFNPT